MKNDFRNDGSNSVSWLADEGAREAKLDGQGFLTPKEKQPPEGDYERLRRRLYEVAHKWVGVAEQTQNYLTQAGFPDLAHAIREGLHDREKGLQRKIKAGVDGQADRLIGGASVEFRADKSTEFGCVDDDEEDLSSLIYNITPDETPFSKSDDWIDHDGSGRPGWLDGTSEVDVIQRDGSIARDTPASRWAWREAGKKSIAKYCLSEGSIIPDGWRRHDGGEPEHPHRAEIEYVTRSGYQGRSPSGYLNWDDSAHEAEIIWYRIISDNDEVGQLDSERFWIKHEGRTFPELLRGKRILIRLRAAGCEFETFKPETLRWTRSSSSGDIVAYKILED